MHRKQVLLTSLVLCLAAVAPAWAGKVDDKVDDFVRTTMIREHVLGLSIAVVKQGKIVKTQGYGFANLETYTLAKPETVYKIASISKQFLATGIMLLVQDGKLSVDDKISKYLEGTPETWKDITIRHLLTHTSGIVREAPGFDPLKIQSDAEVIKTAYPLPLRFTPGEKYEYCNVGYFSLAEIIRKVSGKSWGEFLKERVFAPLLMNATQTTSTTTIVYNRASGYDRKGNEHQNAPNWIALRPSGAFLSTVLDLARWDAALYTDSILKPETRAQMWTPVKLNDGKTYPYGFGWTISSPSGHKLISHGGSLPGFRSVIGRYIDDELTVIVLTNSGYTNPEVFLSGIAAEYIPGLAQK
ncbi:MAG: serine hydrolase domain-containing protein [Armatimonas sp.]